MTPENQKMSSPTFPFQSWKGKKAIFHYLHEAKTVEQPLREGSAHSHHKTSLALRRLQTTRWKWKLSFEWKEVDDFFLLVVDWIRHWRLVTQIRATHVITPDWNIHSHSRIRKIIHSHARIKIIISCSHTMHSHARIKRSLKANQPSIWADKRRFIMSNANA